MPTFYTSLSTQPFPSHCPFLSSTPVSKTSHHHRLHSTAQDTIERQDGIYQQRRDLITFTPNEGSLPTPPGSTPLSPQKMISSGIPSTLDQLPLPSSLNIFLEGAAASNFWSTLIVHSDDYEEHDVYDDYEHYEGSEHRMRIFSLSVSDTDRIVDGSDQAPFIDTPESLGEAGDSLKSQHSQYLQQHDMPLSSQHTRALDSTNLQGMSGCSCHPSNSGNNMDEGELADYRQTSTPKPTGVNIDGDLCCPSSSVITLDACMRNFIQFTSCSLVEALEAVTLHPAVLLGIQDSKGAIKPGADADLVFLSEDLYVKRVFVAGQEVDLGAIHV